MSLIDKLSYSSPLRFKSPFFKFSLSVSTLIICVSAANPLLSIIILFTMVSLTLFWNQTPWRFYGRLLLAPIAFFLLGAVSIFLNIAKSPLDFFAFPIGHHYLTASKEGFLNTIQLVITAFSSTSCLYFLILSTPMTDIFEIFRQLHIPKLIIELMMLIYRFLFLIFELTDSIWISIICRLGNRNMKSSLNAIGKMLSIVLVRALQKSSSLYDSMEARNYNGSILVLTENKKASPLEWGSFLVYNLLLIVLAIVWRIL